MLWFLSLQLESICLIFFLFRCSFDCLENQMWSSLGFPRVLVQPDFTCKEIGSLLCVVDSSGKKLVSGARTGWSTWYWSSRKLHWFLARFSFCLSILLRVRFLLIAISGHPVRVTWVEKLHPTSHIHFNDYILGFVLKASKILFGYKSIIKQIFNSFPCSQDKVRIIATDTTLRSLSQKYIKCPFKK